MKSILIPSLLLIIIGLINPIYSEETCYWKPDGTQVCENEEPHNVWTEEIPSDEGNSKPNSEKSGNNKGSKSSEDLLKYFKENGVEMERLELELVLNYIDGEEHDGLITLTEFETAISNTPAGIVTTFINSFISIDVDDNGKLSKSELQSIFQKTSDNEQVDEIQAIIDNYPEDDIGILVYLDIISQMGSSFADVLKPFKQLDFLSLVEIKKVIQGSVTMFSTMDLDASGALSKEEYMKTMDDPDNKRSKLMGAEQKEAIFGVLDLDKDGQVSYPEFQQVLPQKPKDISKNLQEVFKTADLDSDGFLSEEEFAVHLTTMAAKGNGPLPTEADIEEGFNKLDANEDGKVSEEEMKGILGEIEKLQIEKSTQAFMEMDTDGDGQLSRDEMETIAKVMGQRAGQQVNPDMLIAMLDKNEDGLIQLEEIQAMMKRMLPSS